MIGKAKVFAVRSLAVGILLSALSLRARADERAFTYLYESSVLPQGVFEFEQHLTNQNGKKHGDYAEWNLRSEIEYGITDKLSSALYLNLDSVRADGVPGEESDTKFKGISSEWQYQILNPLNDSVGVAGYGELSTDGVDLELEGKLLVSKVIDRWNFAFNAVYEAEWEREDNRTEKEATVQFLAGASYKVADQWSVGIEARNKSAYPEGLNVSGQEYQTWSVGPNIHYGAPKWWATFTVLPQVWGNGEESQGGRQLVHEEGLEVRLIFGVLL